MCDFLFEVVKHSWVGGTISRRLKIAPNTQQLIMLASISLFFPHLLTQCAPSYLFAVFQVWRHGAKNNCGEGVWVHMLSERGAGHCPACSCHCVKLQSYLPPEPAGGKATSPEGTDPPHDLHFACLCPFFPPCVPVLSTPFRVTEQNTTNFNINPLLSLCVCVYCVGSNLLENLSAEEKKTLIFIELCQQLFSCKMCLFSPLFFLKLFSKTDFFH